MGLAKSKHTTHSAVVAFHTRTWWSRLPDARTLGSVGWNRTTQGVRRWPVSVRTHRPVRQSMSFTVWSPCVDARSFPSGLNAAAMVDRGAGRRSLYVAVQLLSASASAHDPSSFSGQPRVGARHDDDVAGKNRRCAYVLSFCPGWRPDWGGALQFFGPDGNVEGAFTPAHNALSLFRVPMDHSVGVVAPYAGSDRYSITGWLRSGADPGVA